VILQPGELRGVSLMPVRQESTPPPSPLPETEMRDILKGERPFDVVEDEP